MTERANRNLRVWAVCAACALVTVPARSETPVGSDSVRAHVVLAVPADRRTARIERALERVPDGIQERLNLVGAHIVVMGARAPREHTLRKRVNRDIFATGFRWLAAPFIRVQGRTYPLDQVAFVRRGARGPVGRSRLFTRWIPLTGRGEESALHEIGHLLAFALNLAIETEFFILWAEHAPEPPLDALSPLSEGRQQQEWFARAFERFYGSEESRSKLSGNLVRYLEALEQRILEGAYDGQLLEYARLSSTNSYLAAARELGERLLPAVVAGELRQRGAWGLGFYGQQWYALQSANMRAAHGSLYSVLADRRSELVESGLAASSSDIHLRETCGDLGATRLCQAVRRHRSRLEIWHPCLGSPIEGCLVSLGPNRDLLDRHAGEFPWLSADRHREIAFGTSTARIEPVRIER